MIKLKNHRGFTLSEVMIVVSILVIISILLLIGLNPMAQFLKGFDTRRKDDLHKLKIAFEAYYADHECYPPKTVLDQCGSAVLKPYLNAIPCDPDDGLPYDLAIYPDNSVCPQQYAIYAPIMSFYDKDANNIPGCPKTIAVNSPDMENVDISAGCGVSRECYYLYGCVRGACVQVAEGGTSVCSPTYCESDCGGVQCSAKNLQDEYVNECVEP